MKNCDEKYFDPLNTFQKLLCDLVSARKECAKRHIFSSCLTSLPMTF